MWKWLAILALSGTPSGPGFGLSVGGASDSGAPVRPRPPPPTPEPAIDCSKRQAPDRGCSTDSDCVTVSYMASCCGTMAMKGVSRSDAARFQAELAQCAPRGRTCGCASGPTSLDEGSLRDRADQVRVACRANLCTTFAEPRPRPVLTSASVQALPSCPAAACGTSPALPNWSCPDGVSVGGRGPCVRIDGRCRWTQLECP